MPFSLLENYSAAPITQDPLMAQLTFRQYLHSNWHVLEVGNLVDMVNGTQHSRSFYYEIASQTA